MGGGRGGVEGSLEGAMGLGVWGFRDSLLGAPTWVQGLNRFEEGLGKTLFGLL